MNHFMAKTLQGLLNICLFRASPAVLPYSYLLLAILIFISFVVRAQELYQSFHIPLLEEYASGLLFKSLLEPFLELSIFMGVLYFLLKQRNLASRCNQVLIAFLGTELILKAFFHIAWAIAPEDMVDSVKIIYAFWSFLVAGYIVKEAFETKMLFGLLIMLGVNLAASIPMLLFSTEIQILLQANPNV